LLATDRRITLAVLLAAMSLPGLAADFEAKAGGVALTLPAPSREFEEVGDRLRSMAFEAMTPSANRLLAAYLQSATLKKLADGSTKDLGIYGMLQVPRRYEYADCGPNDFAEVRKSTAGEMGGVADQKIGDIEAEMNVRLKSLGADPVSTGKPQALGKFFEKTDAAGFGMLMPVTAGKETVQMAFGVGLMRVRQRLMFVYLYSRYESPETVQTLRKLLESWCDAILAANKTAK
jgi:hypothetical protein